MRSKLATIEVGPIDLVRPTMSSAWPVDGPTQTSLAVAPVGRLAPRKTMSMTRSLVAPVGSTAVSGGPSTDRQLEQTVLRPSLLRKRIDRFPTGAPAATVRRLVIRLAVLEVSSPVVTVLLAATIVILGSTVPL